MTNSTLFQLHSFMNLLDFINKTSMTSQWENTRLIGLYLLNFKFGPIGKMKAFTYFKMIFYCVNHKFRTMVFLVRLSQKYVLKEDTKTQYADRK